MSDFNCDGAREQFAVLLYGELSFDDEERLESHLDACAECRAGLARERSVHAALDSVEIVPSPSLLRVCREELRARIAEAEALPQRPAHGAAWWERFTDFVTGRNAGRSGLSWKPAAALTLIAIGFFAARLTPMLANFGSNGRGLDAMGMTDPGSSRVRYVEPGSDGKIQIVLDETRQRVISGRLDDQRIRALLLAAVTDPGAPGF